MKSTSHIQMDEPVHKLFDDLVSILSLKFGSNSQYIGPLCWSLLAQIISTANIIVWQTKRTTMIIKM